jgi:predicted DCC family thiol-disulfide oxidoreductase YuxK
MYEHIVFFDHECPFCHRAVRHIIAIDRESRFRFAPLTGQTASKILIGPQASLREAQSLVLAEHYLSTQRDFFIQSRAILRIYWLIGGKWKWLGLLSFLPSWPGDLFYRWFAAHRHQLKLKLPTDPGPRDLFLP